MSGKPKHGLSRTHEYRVWLGIVARCTNPSHPAYPSYGGRGITVCDRWRDDVHAFIADVGPRPDRHEIDRIDNDRGYEPGNVRWTDRKTNDRNRRSSRMLTHQGETLALAGWCERLALPRDTVRKRLEAGWSVEDALSTPVAPKAEAGSAVRNPSRRCEVCGGTTVDKHHRTCSEQCRRDLMSLRAIEREKRKRANCPELIARDEVAA